MGEPAPDLRADVSADLAELLRTSDALLREWEELGAQVRTQVRREVATIGHSVARAVDEVTRDAAAQAADRTEAACARAMAGALGASLERLRHGLTQAEARIAALGRAHEDERRRRRWSLWAGLGALVLVQLVTTLWLAARLAAPATDAAVARPDAAPIDRAAPAPTGSSAGPIDPRPQAPVTAAPTSGLGAGVDAAPATDAAGPRPDAAPRAVVAPGAPPRPHAPTRRRRGPTEPPP